MTGPVADSGASGLASSIGRYFSVVSFVPTLVLVAWVVFLVKSGAWSGRPNWGNAAKAFLEPSAMGAALVVLVSLVLGIAMHSLQFVLVQTLEGYWGVSSFGIALRAARTVKHFEMRRYLSDLKMNSSSQLGTVPTGARAQWYTLLTGQREAYRKLAYYPRVDHLLPTRLGNVLRVFETRAGEQYNLSILTFAEHLAHVAPREQVDYVNDQRTALDLAVRFCFVGLAGSLISVLFLWSHGLWLLVALVPYALAYCSYRGAVAVAYHYGRALSTLVDLNRFALYERLRVKPPQNTGEERDIGKRLTHLMKDYDSTVLVEYVEPVKEQADGPDQSR